MTEPIKLPPDLLAVTLVREGVNKHRARDIEQWMNEKMAQAVESATGALHAEVERLRADAADFHITYRMKCDEETKAKAVEVERLRAELARLTKLPSPPPLWGKGCPVCGIGSQPGVYGVVCARGDCPTRVTCGETK
jgi:hypothetical protein